MSFGQIVLFLIGIFIFYKVVKNWGFLIMLRAVRIYSKGEKEKGVTLIQKALKFPMAAKHKLTCGYFLLKEGHLDEADRVIAPMRTAKEKKYNPNQARVYYSLVLWKQGKLDEAIESLEGLLKEDYQTAVLYTNLGFFLIEKGDYDRALEINQAGIEYDSTSAVIQDNLGLNYIKLGEWEKALEIYDAMLPNLPGFPDAYVNRALIHMHYDEWEEAKDLLFKAEGKTFTFLSTMSREDVIKQREEVEAKLAQTAH
jgi:tetratricopeptide (TPR) repeat protein